MSAIHLPRRLTFVISNRLARMARRSPLSWSRKTPDRIMRPFCRNRVFQSGNAATSNSLKRFAVMTSNFLRPVIRIASSSAKRTPRMALARAFCLAVAIARESLSIARTSCAPKQRPASARIPVPVPASSIRQSSFHPRVASSSRRRHIAVVACWPVPNAAAAGIIRRGQMRGNRRVTGSFPPFKMTSLLPILRGSVCCPRKARCSQSRGSGSIFPPNSERSFFAVRQFRQQISNRTRERPGCSITANAPLARVCSSSS